MAKSDTLRLNLTYTRHVVQTSKSVRHSRFHSNYGTYPEGTLTKPIKSAGQHLPYPWLVPAIRWNIFARKHRPVCLRNPLPPSIKARHLSTRLPLFFFFSHTYLLGNAAIKKTVILRGSPALHIVERTSYESPSGASLGQFLVSAF